MGRVKQTARKGSGGWPARSSRRRLPPPEVREPLKRDERPTGQEYLDAVSSIRVQRQGQDSTDASLGREEGIATQPCSIADARNALPALSPELLQQVFEKLGAHPKDLVPLAAVCKQARAVFYHAVCDLR